MRFLLVLVVLLGGVGRLVAQFVAKPISVSVSGIHVRSYFAGSFGLACGLRYGRHELGGHFEDAHRVLTTAGGYYRFYWPKNERICRPYVGAFESSGRLERTGESAKHFGLGLGLGAEHSVWQGFAVYYQVGLERGSIISNARSGGVFTAPFFSAGARYNLRIAGPKGENLGISHDFAGENVLFLNLKATCNPYAFPQYGLPTDDFLNFEPSVEVRVLDWLRPFAGITLGQLTYQSFSDSGGTNFTLKGITGGVRVFSLVRPRWAFFEELSATYTHRPKWRLYGSRFTIGHGLSLKVMPGLFVNGMVSFQWDDFNEYILGSAGVTVAPFRK